jgi:PTS system nitrogen regulatory IIA component
MLAAISQVLSQPGAVEELLAAASVQALEESFLRRARDEVSAGYRGRSLFHVFVQDDGAFRQVLQAIVGVGSTPAAVVEAQNLHTYLGKVPLFAGLWRDEPSATSRVILAVVDKKLTNETLRRIEQVTGPLDERRDVLVTIQDIFFSAGSLEP